LQLLKHMPKVVLCGLSHCECKHYTVYQIMDKFIREEQGVLLMAPLNDYLQKKVLKL
jgi:hypothetical protein